MIVYDGPGDIFQYRGDAVTCPVNSVGVMGNGLALAFRNNVEGLFDFFSERYPKTSDEQLASRRAGFLHLFEGHNPKVLLFPTKVFFYRESILPLIDHNLGVLARFHREMNINSVALPHLGCGKGGLDYMSQVKPLIYKHFQEHPLSVSILG